MGTHTTLWTPSTQPVRVSSRGCSRTRTQDHGCAQFKRYGSTFRHHRCTKGINSKVITYSFSATELLTLFYRLVRGDIGLVLNGMLSRSRYINYILILAFLQHEKQLSRKHKSEIQFMFLKVSATSLGFAFQTELSHGAHPGNGRKEGSFSFLQ